MTKISAHKTIYIIASVLVLAIVAGGLLFFQATKEIQIIPPRDAPSFSLKTFAGQEISLESISSELVFINFWATFCEPCRDELPALQEIQQQFKTEQLTILTINMDLDIKLAQKFISDYGIMLPTVHDKWYKVADAYGYTGLPTSFLLNRERKIIKTYSGFKMGQEKKYLEDIRDNLGTNN